jgi:uncharacterized membrane protein
MEGLFRSFAGSVALVVEIAAIAIVTVGSLDSFLRIVVGMSRRRLATGDGKEIWRRFGMWLLLGLEFELAADIVRTAIAPTWTEIGQLGAIAIIRTLLNYFLERDLEASRAGGESPRIEPSRPTESVPNG